jgi:hypothetical protein
MNSKLVKASSALTLFVLMTSVVASNAPAFAINGHGVAYWPEFGAGPFMTYKDGLKINGAAFDISGKYSGIIPPAEYSTTIPTQTLYINDKSDVTLKIFEVTTAKDIQHVVLFLNLQGNDPQSYQTNTHIDWDKNLGVSVSDPTGIFSKVTTSVTYNKQLMWLTFHIVPANSMPTSHMIVRAWDSNLSVGQVIVKNALNIGYLPLSSRTNIS